jgi:hypothetical protein
MRTVELSNATQFGLDVVAIAELDEIAALFVLLVLTIDLRVD